MAYYFASKTDNQTDNEDNSSGKVYIAMLVCYFGSFLIDVIIWISVNTVFFFTLQSPVFTD